MDAGDKDLSYEEDILRDPYSLQNWQYYLEYKIHAPQNVRYMIYERALRRLPGSYKLWFTYLMERVENCKVLCITDMAYERTNAAFERSLVHMYKMPRIWKEYCRFLMKQQKIHQTRMVFDRALRSLPITQHAKWIWPSYLEFANACKVSETGMRIWRRYLKLYPNEKEDFCKYLKKMGRIEEAVAVLADMVNDDKFVSQHGKSKHDLWQELLKLLVSNPQKVKKLNVDAIIRSGIKRLSHEVGRLWCALADFYIRLGHFEKARDIFEQGINTVNTVRDFNIIYDAYVKYEETMLTAKMQEAQEDEDDEEDEEDDEDEELANDVELDMRLMRLEDLADRQPLLLSSVLLRQNPHNVSEWRKRVKLFKDDPTQTIMTYTDAVTTVDPQKATGKPHMLWCEFAQFYADHGDIDNARVILEKATKVNYKSMDDLASVYCFWAELELANKNYEKALSTLKEACTVPDRDIRLFRKGGTAHIPVQQKIFKSTKLWSFLADLEESLGTLDSVRLTYNQMIDLKVATPQNILNFAKILEEHKFFEESYRVYEKGVAVFGYPHVYPIWVTYLKKFIGRYGGTKVERTRDLFEQAVCGAPGKEVRKLYLLYAKYEEEFGLARRAMNVYDRACLAALPKDRYQLYMIYIARCAEFFGATKTREIYEKSLQHLPEEGLKAMCVKYSQLERQLGEIDRARMILSYASQFCNPSVDTAFWKSWHDFEILHGNEDTFRDMLRVRRSVQAQYSQVNLMATGGAIDAAKAGKPAEPSSSIEALEKEAEALQAAKKAANEKRKAEEELNRKAEQEKAVAAAAAAATQNPDEVDLGDDSD
eukprot:g7200.t1